MPLNARLPRRGVEPGRFALVHFYPWLPCANHRAKPRALVADSRKNNPRRVRIFPASVNSNVYHLARFAMRVQVFHFHGILVTSPAASFSFLQLFASARRWNIFAKDVPRGVLLGPFPIPDLYRGPMKSYRVLYI